MGDRKTGQLSRDQILRLVLTALFAAICFVVIWLKIPIGEQFVHPGNAMCILAALLLGGVPGGIAGSIGMGLFDLLFYPTSIFKTLILKFLMGLIAGLIFHYGKKRPQSRPQIGLAAASGLSLVFGLWILITYLGKETKELTLLMPSLFLLILGGVLAVILAVSLSTKKIGHVTLYAILGATAGVAFNVAGEFVWKTAENLLYGMPFNAAVAATIVKIPATFLNGSFSVFLAVLLYLPIRSALQKAKLDSMLA